MIKLSFVLIRKYFQDATKGADIEREKYIELERKQESKKRELMDKEKMLLSKQTELEMSIDQRNEQKVR